MPIRSLLLAHLRLVPQDDEVQRRQQRFPMRDRSFRHLFHVECMLQEVCQHSASGSISLTSNSQHQVIWAKTAKCAFVKSDCAPLPETSLPLLVAVSFASTRSHSSMVASTWF